MLKINLAKREKYVVITAACLIALFLLINFLILPFFKEKSRLRKDITVKEGEFKEIGALSLVYQEYQKGSSNISRVLAKRDKGFSLTDYLETAARKTGMKDNLQGLTSSPSKGSGLYKESTVEVKLEGINADRLVKYLNEIEAPDDLIFIKRLSIAKNKKDKGYLDLIIQVLTFQ